MECLSKEKSLLLFSLLLALAFETKKNRVVHEKEGGKKDKEYIVKLKKSFCSFLVFQSPSSSRCGISIST